MKTLLKFATPMLVVLFSTVASAEVAEQSDAAQAYADAVSQKTINYRCDTGKRVSVTYGFNEQGLPTYAQANVSGKTRSMPINLNRTGSDGTVFGDENNFSLSGEVMDSKNYRQANTMIMNPASEILYKGCVAR